MINLFTTFGIYFKTLPRFLKQENLNLFLDGISKKIAPLLTLWDCKIFYLVRPNRKAAYVSCGDKNQVERSSKDYFFVVAIFLFLFFSLSFEFFSWNELSKTNL